MNNAISPASLGAAPFAKWLSLTLIVSSLAIAGLVATISQPDRHPFVLAFSLLWVVSVTVSAVARDGLIKLDPLHFRPTSWEREGEIYPMLGVTVFRWILLHTPLGWLSPMLQLRTRRSDLERLMRELNFAEGTHKIAGTLTLAIAAGYSLAGHLQVGFWLFLLTILSHAYPVMLQRWNRARVVRAFRQIR